MHGSRTGWWAGAVVVAIVGVAACSSARATAPSATTTPAAALALQPTLSDQFPTSTNLVLATAGGRRPTIVDTGSIYYFAGDPANDVTLDCAHPGAFHYGGGTATYCPARAPLRATGIDGAVVRLAPRVSMGRARFTDFLAPYAIIGLSANLEQENLPGLRPIVEQLRPDFLSFRFPNGGQNNASVAFGPLPARELRGVPAVPLVSPGGLGYGYTARVQRVDFIASDSIRASIRTERDGVYLERDGGRTKIAASNLAFFDTGATEPYVPLNGDISLLSDRVPDAMIPFAGQEPYDAIQFTFDVGHGDHVVLANRTVRAYAPGPFLSVPTASDFPPGLEQLTTVVGLGTLAGYDFQFTFEDGRAVSARFVQR